MAKTSTQRLVRQQRGSKYKTRNYNRCKRCGRPRAYLRKFGLCRICLPRDRPRRAWIPGLTKSKLVTMQTDPIADFLTRIRNGLRADHDEVAMPASTFKAELARILTEQGYVESYEVEPARVGVARCA